MPLNLAGALKVLVAPTVKVSVLALPIIVSPFKVTVPVLPADILLILKLFP